MSGDKLFKWLEDHMGTTIVIITLVQLVVWSAIVYAAIHFIRKLW